PVSVRLLVTLLAAAAVVLLARTGLIQLVEADRIVVTPSLGEQADGAVRYQYNPRLLAAARQIVRGTIYDRHHLPLATSRPDEMKPAAAQDREAGIEPGQACAAAPARRCPRAGAPLPRGAPARAQAGLAPHRASLMAHGGDRRP